MSITITLFICYQNGTYLARHLPYRYQAPKNRIKIVTEGLRDALYQLPKTGALKMRDRKMQDRKMRDQWCQKMNDQIALLKISGLKMHDWKMRDRKMQAQNFMIKMQDRKTRDRKMRDWKTQDWKMQDPWYTYHANVLLLFSKSVADFCLGKHFSHIIFNVYNNYNYINWIFKKCLGWSLPLVAHTCV